ncbi:DinB family protein [Pseudonocardia acaciae]|uniref:DinB family protein n=1 Tax=Pseudonocardia acaciae TaxID=551276 RepID=UPI00048BFEC7|nr:DinB family protein [Pseudonocardia acaciae]
MTDPKGDLHEYLRAGREAMLWKLEGVSEYDVRRPLTRTGTNLLGLVKHLIGVELGYFGPTFGRPYEPLPSWISDEAFEADPNVDMWATEDEPREWIIGLYRAAWAHADATIEMCALDAVGRVEHWPPERAEITLHRVLVHVTAETHRHAGHADIVREVIDGAVGLRRDRDNMAPGDEAAWAEHRERVERAAGAAAGR